MSVKPLWAGSPPGPLFRRCRHANQGAARRRSPTPKNGGAAVEDARVKATTIATALGRELGEALEVRGGSGQPSPRVELGSMALARAGTPVEAGDQVVRANVTVRFALGAGGSPD